MLSAILALKDFRIIVLYRTFVFKSLPARLLQQITASKIWAALVRSCITVFCNGKKKAYSM